MSIHTVRFLSCDGPQCQARETDPASFGIPEGWTRVRSTAHIPEGIGRRRGALSTWQRETGGFSLDLCPAHPEAFAEHKPMTDGRPGDGSSRAAATVSCSCGARLGWAYHAHTLAPAPVGPSADVERLWWRHLPAELQEYALRRPGVAA